MNKTIYIPDEIYDELVKRADVEGISFSKVILKGFGIERGYDKKQTPGPHNDYTVQLDRMEAAMSRAAKSAERLDEILAKLDLLIPKGMPDSLRNGKNPESDDSVECNVAKVLAEGQKKLDAERREKKAMVRNAESMAGFAGAFTKDAQLGKKAKK